MGKEGRRIVVRPGENVVNKREHITLQDRVMLRNNPDMFKAVDSSFVDGMSMNFLLQERSRQLI